MRKKIESLRMKGFGGILLCFSLFFFISSAVADTIDAPSAVAVDAQTGKILYGKNPHLKLPPASTTKLVTTMVALDRLSPQQKVTISERAAKTHSVEPKLKEGETYTVHDLIYLALMRSVNSAAVALAEAVSGSEETFVKLMNEKVKQIGAKDTKFANASGLPGKEQYTTVFDLTKIMSKALSYPLIKEAIHTRVCLVRSEDGKEHFIQNTNQLLWVEDGMIGGKTGYTSRARHCFVSATTIDNRLVYTAILGVSNREKLWKETKILLAKAEDILSGKNEPFVHFTSEKNIVKASYKKSKSAESRKKVISTKNKSSKKQHAVKRSPNKKSTQTRGNNAKINSQSI
ncbi:D-alanyl-D-alanine carboxypeptidase family protein [Thermodesulfovibrio sp.]|uniref:D-alanyl-D-alanine carboxypeptidase family protein n=1 Tax=Thermodesulfovibrio sp. TaxID=2067987 RepID=UPI0030A260B8